MYEPFETYEHAGCTIELHQDPEPMSPGDWDQAGTLVAFDGLWREWRFAARNSSDREDEAVDRGGAALLVRYLRAAHKITAVPFYFADYGSTGAHIYETDDEPSGFIFTTDARCAELGVTDAEAALRAELREWDAYVAGEVVGYVVRAGDEVVDSCWGFYPEQGGALEYVKREAEGAAEWEAVERERAARMDIATV